MVLADIGIGEIELNYDRREAVDLTYPYIIDDITFTSPPPKLYQTTSLFKPFDTNVWIWSLVMIAITSTLLRISSGTSNSEHKIQTIEDLANAQESGIRHLNITQELANI
ncbi:unnamed protein product [Oppiella nova]|uniref:Uncharacterized protein n=1 Tax=Oppiella nova TaxID=334625 RepID=A0A7R9QGF6_9ACAR|nr:unnamed protein product [Oppiella nova]CAG2164503.1 unnamed protein product [Oppiella nova]